MNTKLALLSATLVFTISGAVFAGYRSGGTVTVDRKARYAGGGLGAARNSGDTLQSVACNVQSVPGSAPLVLCDATSAAGVNGGCWSYDPSILAAAQAVSGDSWLDFRWDATTGACTALNVANTSTMELKR